jgi:hypothetical protein
MDKSNCHGGDVRLREGTQGGALKAHATTQQDHAASKAALPEAATEPFDWRQLDLRVKR